MAGTNERGLGGPDVCVSGQDCGGVRSLRCLLGLTALLKKQDPVASVSQQRCRALEGPKREFVLASDCLVVLNSALLGC